MGKVETLRATLRALPDEPAWVVFLEAHSGLPGPRGNLELAHAFAQEADPALAQRLAALDAAAAPTNTPGEFLAFCGVLAMGPLAARGDAQAPAVLRSAANDMRWRVREAAATALQLWADDDPAAALATAQRWAAGTRLEQRAAVAGVAEPRLLRNAEFAAAALALVDGVTASLRGAADAASADARVLRQALGYAWSVVIVGAPAAGRQRFAALAADSDADIVWIVRENLKKARLARLDPAWVSSLRARV